MNNTYSPITRATMRADGLTVGEAMDRDAAFLRSLGIDAQDGAKPIDEKREDFVQLMRNAVLSALDQAGATIGADGWKDQDLPALFKAIDGQARTVFDRVS